MFAGGEALQAGRRAQAAAGPFAAASPAGAAASAAAAAQADALLPARVDCCDVCYACPIQTPAVFRCTTCVAWAACGSCAAVCRLPLRDRAAAADAHPGWHPAPPGGPCACCGARASALWRRGAPAPAAPALFCAACCALAVPGAAPACPPVEVHDGGTHAVVAHPTAAGGGAGGGAHPAADPAEPLACGPLRDVVLSATRRWFCDALRAAKQGDGGSMELVAWEYAEGYGCARDAELARFWRQAAREHGARRIEGVYDELD